MRRLIIVVLIAMMLSITAIPVDDLDSSSTTTVRLGNNTLMHATVECIRDCSHPAEGLWGYEPGYDSSMKNYIANYRTAAAPVSQIINYESGKQYEIYYLDWPYDPYSDFKFISGPQRVLDPYYYDLDIDERTQITVTFVKSLTSGEDRLYIYDVTDTTEDDYTSLREGRSVALNYLGDGHHYSIKPYGWTEHLFVEVQLEIERKTFTGSPALYVAFSTAVVVLVGATMFICGRKPKL